MKSLIFIFILKLIKFVSKYLSRQKRAFCVYIKEIKHFLSVVDICLILVQGQKYETLSEGRTH